MRIMKTVAVLALALAATVVVPAAANAAPPVTTASADQFVIWLDPNFSGPAAGMDNHLPSYGNLVYAGTNIPINNSASSAANYAPDFVVIAFREEGLRFCDRTAPRLLFLRQGQVTAQESWFYANLAQQNFDNDISGHCFVG